MTLLFSRMGDLPVGYRARLRELTIGPVAWGLWSLTMHDGSTWALLAMRDEEILGWGCVTKEYDLEPMIGVYVDPSHRGQGLGATIVTSLARQLLGCGELATGDRVNAATWRWSRYEELLASCELECVSWE